MSLITGESVVVVRRNVSLDELGEPTEGEPDRETVENVVVAPGATSDLDASRPDGIVVAYSLCFPKGYGKSLRGCSVEVRGTEYAVVGDPKEYTEANTPGDWNLTVEVTRTDG
jgi:hypothetical protein